MDIDFVDGKDRFFVIYLDDIQIFSKFIEDHMQHLKIVFEKCRKYGISLNPNKSLFGLEEGKLLGHIISKYGIQIDPSRIEAIQKLDIPRNKKEVQYFLGRINFLRRFIPNLAEILTTITNMLRKDSEIKWDAEERIYLSEVKSSLTHAPVLASPDYIKEFITVSFSLEHTIAAMLMHKNKEGYEQPIAFFSRVLRDASLKYNIMEK